MSVNSLVFFIEQTATGLYILAGVGILVMVFRWLRANGELRATYYELERDIARFRRVNAFTGLALLIEIALIVVGMQRVVAPTLRQTNDMSVSIVLNDISDGDFRTFTPAPIDSGILIDASGVILGDQNPADLIQPTPTLTPTPVGTIIPNAPPADCDDPRVSLMIPANGMLVFEPTSVVGVATVENFAYYRFELRGESTTGSFATLERDYTEAVADIGQLGQFVPAFYAPGLYQFRVAVFDLSNMMQASCTINIYISDPIPTPTPLGTQAAGQNSTPRSS